MKLLHWIADAIVALCIAIVIRICSEPEDIDVSED